MARQDEYVRYTIRVPRDVYERIADLPGEGSINAKIVRVLSGYADWSHRDDFAVAALTVTLSSSDRPTWAAQRAYAVADAMLAERLK